MEIVKISGQAYYSYGEAHLIKPLCDVERAWRSETDLVATGRFEIFPKEKVVKQTSIEGNQVLLKTYVFKGYIKPILGEVSIISTKSHGSETAFVLCQVGHILYDTRNRYYWRIKQGGEIEQFRLLSDEDNLAIEKFNQHIAEKEMEIKRQKDLEDEAKRPDVKMVCRKCNIAISTKQAKPELRLTCFGGAGWWEVYHCPTCGTTYELNRQHQERTETHQVGIRFHGRVHYGPSNVYGIGTHSTRKIPFTAIIGVKEVVNGVEVPWSRNLEMPKEYQ